MKPTLHSHSQTLTTTWKHKQTHRQRTFPNDGRCMPSLHRQITFKKACIQQTQGSATAVPVPCTHTSTCQAALHVALHPCAAGMMHQPAKCRWSASGIPQTTQHVQLVWFIICIGKVHVINCTPLNVKAHPPPTKRKKNQDESIKI